MGENEAPDAGLSVVLVDGGDGRAIVPLESQGRWLVRSEGTVTMDGIRRAARKVRREQSGRNMGAVVEGTLGAVAVRAGSRPPDRMRDSLKDADQRRNRS